MYKILYLPDSKFIKMGVFALILDSHDKYSLLWNDFVSKTYKDAENQLNCDLVRWKNFLTPDEKKY